MLLATGFVNPDGSVAIVVMNQTAKASEYHIRVGTAELTVQSRPHSIQTVVF
jgi:glucosylceramidase